MQLLRFTAMSLLSSIALGACSVVGIRSGTEEPRYTVLQKQDSLEIRQYGPRLAADTEVTGSEYSARYIGFRRLAHYIFGGNSTSGSIAMTAPVSQAGGSQKIAMTAPVGQEQGAPGVWRIRFFMPAQYTEATLPRPDDPAVHIVSVPAETYGVYRYTGSIDAAATAAANRELLHKLESSGWIPIGQPVSWFYDPPWTIPFLRRNEAAVAVAKVPRQ
jgi:SOUL heme-binding protein